LNADGTSGIAVENGAGSNRLVRFDPRTGEVSALREFDPNVHWAEPRWSPRGDLIAVSRWSAGGRYDVVVLDPAGRVIEEVTHGVGINGSPAWSPDGRWVVFSSDRSGIANLYAYDRQRAKLLQLSNVLTGAFQPDVSPDGHAVVFSAYHHDGFHIEAMPFDTAALREPSPARLPQLPASAQPQLSTATRAAAVPTGASIDTSTTAPGPYRAARSLAPTWWMPLVLDQESGTFLGASSGGEDLVGRHAWSGWAALATSTARLAGGAWYGYRGIPPIAGTRLQPSLQLSAAREWDRLSSPAQPGDPYVEEREDVLGARAVLLHRRYRSITSVGLGGELVSRRRLLIDAPGRRLLDPADALYGASASMLFSNARSYPFSMSAEDGITVQLGAGQWWDRSPGSGVSAEGDTVRFDASEREFSAWSAGYLSLGRVAFANAVLGIRGSALLRDGPGASTAGVGGTSGGSLPFGELLDLGGSRFLPVRGFPPSTRRGTRAWSVSAELRVPLALLASRPRPLPLYLDRLSLAAFADAGNAACATDEACDPMRLGPTLLSAGAELWLETSLLGFGVLLRAGGAAPVQGSDSHAPRWYLQVGAPF
jgi:hypothetical protein